MSNYDVIYEAIGKIETTVTYLQMCDPPLNWQKPQRKGAEIVHVQKPTLSFYRFLYDQVGREWNWTKRKLMDDNALSEAIHNPNVEIFVLSFGGCPAGYIEIEMQDGGRDIELVYFGLMSPFIGKGLGSFLMQWVMWYVWKEKKPKRLWVHTCTLDGPTALATYTRAGFEKYHQEQEFVDIVRPVVVQVPKKA